MPNLYTACWTMNNSDFGTKNRINALERVALTADTSLKVMGRIAGGDFQRLLIVPEYFFESGSGLLSRDQKHDIYNQLIKISARVPDLILVAGSIAYGKGKNTKKTFNVCPILHKGEIVKKLYKANDDGVYETNGSFCTKTGGSKGVPVVTINGVTIGLDICMDYNNDRLAKYLKKHSLGDPDVHIQISGSNNSSRGRSVAKDGGVYVHCDQGGKGTNGATAWRITSRVGLNAGTTQIQPVETQNPGIGRVMFFNTAI
ncbi:hypothetical protein A9Q99_14490 [Gammaproteobacteria bacterium 45_16_T64]|nr:hypothetical protein A9Q99_14490 [Gammaproteobacteria bacterium 45_16_T64]